MTGYLSKPPPGNNKNLNHALTQGMVGCWAFNEGSGLLVNDVCGNNNQGILTNFEPFSATSGWTGGNYGTALQFDGVNDVVNSGNRPSLDLTLFSIAGWVNTRDATVEQAIVTKSNAGATISNYELSIRTTKATIRYFAGAATRILQGATNVSSNAWVHLLGTWDGKFLRIYLNGVLDGTSADLSANPPVTNTQNVNIGARVTSIPFSGRISLACIWNRTLNSIEVQNLYAQEFDMFNF